MRKNKLIFFGLTLLAGVILGLTIGIKWDIFSPAQGQVATAPAVTLPSLEGFRMEDAVVNVANTTGKAVVSISIEHTAKFGGARRFYFNQPFGGSPSEEDPFRKFFDDFFGEMPEREYKQMGLGSGVIIDPEGYILTNQHVVEGADKITVKLPDGRDFKGEIKGQDPRSDLAVIKINARNLPVASLGESDNLKIGQWVVAIGNPFGFALTNPEPTVTVGVISALHRSLGRALSSDRDYNDLIQTDAAINPGNSGGPLVNLKGEIVGMNVAIFSTTGGYQGVGFAIPINNAKRIISRLIEGKKILYGWLGVSAQDLTEDLAKHFGLLDKNGVLVGQVFEGSPAQKSGVKDGDIIKQFDGKTINNAKELVGVVGQTEVGRKVKVLIIRDKKELALEVEVGERPQNLEEAGFSTTEEKAKNWRGLTVEDLTSGNAKRLRVKEETGVVVVDVEPNTSADEAGIVPGDIIIGINKQNIKNISDYNKIIQGLKGDALVKTLRGYFLIKE